MRSLSLLRHAKSSWDDESLDDFHRPLNDRGRRAALVMGRHLATSGTTFDLVLASPAQRVVETLQGLAAGGWEAPPQRFEVGIYHATTRDLLNLVRATPDEVGRLLVVGHNPTLGSVTVHLSRDDDAGLRAQAAAKYPTGTLAEIALDVSGWADVGGGSGTLVAFTTPRSLEP